MAPATCGGFRGFFAATHFHFLRLPRAHLCWAVFVLFMPSFLIVAHFSLLYYRFHLADVPSLACIFIFVAISLLHYGHCAWLLAPLLFHRTHLGCCFVFVLGALASLSQAQPQAWLLPLFILAAHGARYTWSSSAELVIHTCDFGTSAVLFYCVDLHTCRCR